jgi:ABC-type multidrug transport system permease subunit
MGFFGDAVTIYTREMIIFKANLRTNIIRSILFPIIIILFFGSIGATLARGVPIAIVNYANNPKANAFISALSSSPTQLDVKTITDQNTALALLKNGSVNLVVVVLPTFPSSYHNQASVALYYTNSFTDLGNSLSFVSTTASQYSATTAINPVAEAEQLNTQQSISATPAHAQVSYNLISGAQSGYKSFVATGVIGMVVIFGAVFGGGMSMITDRQLGNLKAFIISPINKDSIVLGKMMAGTLQSLIYGMVALGIVLLDGVTIALGLVGIFWIVILILVLSFGFSAVTVILSSRINKVEVYAILAQIVNLPLWFISGGITPVNMLPNWIAPLSVIDPLTYLNNGIRAVVINGYYPLSTALQQIGILLLFSAICIVIAFKIFKGTIE